MITTSASNVVWLQTIQLKTVRLLFAVGTVEVKVIQRFIWLKAVGGSQVKSASFRESSHVTHGKEHGDVL